MQVGFPLSIKKNSTVAVAISTSFSAFYSQMCAVVGPAKTVEKEECDRDCSRTSLT
jgi:hypothetical protein